VIRSGAAGSHATPPDRASTRPGAAGAKGIGVPGIRLAQVVPPHGEAPHTGQPLTEAMVLGVGGGLGAGYILWEFQEHARRHVVLGFRNDWQYPARWAGKTCRRLRVPVAAHETGAARKAEAQLRAAVDQASRRSPGSTSSWSATGTCRARWPATAATR